MQKAVLIIFSLLFFAYASTPQQVDEEEVKSLWSAWKLTNKRLYSTEEDATRFAIFMENYKYIVEFNAESTSVKLGLNKMADLTKEEFKQRYLGFAFQKPEPQVIKAETIQLPKFNDLPQTVNWTAQGAVGPVKDQGQCGSCWAFATVGALESYHYLQYGGDMLSFSEQQVIDCNREPNMGCEGGYPYTVFDYASTYGLQLESDYPYLEKQQSTCQYQKSKAYQVNMGYSFVQSNSQEMLKNALAIAPTVVGIEADQNVFQFYQKGVISYGCGANVDHAVLAVGFGVVDGIEAFIVKNSWGDSWGLNGYVYLATDSGLNKGAGACGILTIPVFPF